MTIPIRRFAGQHRVVVAALVLFAFYVWIALVWHCIDTRPPRWDEAHGLMISQHSYQALQRGDIVGALCLKNVTNTKPGMVSFLSALSYFVIGDDPRVATFVINACSMLVIFLALVKMSVDLFDRVDVGLLACLLFANAGAVLVWTGYYQSDLPLVAAVCGTVVLCMAIDRHDFAGYKLAVLLALCLAVGISIKHLFVVFTAGPLAALALRAVIRSLRPLRVSFRGRVFLLAAMGVGVGLGVSYHTLNIHILREQLARSHDAALTGGPAEVPSAWAMLMKVIEFLPPPAWLGLLLASTGVLVLRTRRQVVYPLLSVILGYIGVGYVASFPMPYYFMPMIPFGCLLACGVLAFPLPATRKPFRVIEAVRSAAVGVMVLALAGVYSANRLGTPNLLRVAWNTPRVAASAGELTCNPLAATKYWDVKSLDGNAAVLPYPHHWPVRDMAMEIRARVDPAADRSFTVLYCTGAYEWMTDEWLIYELKRLRLLSCVGMVQLRPPPADKTPEQILADYDFLIIKTGLIAKQNFLTADWYKPLQDFVDQLAQDHYARLHAAGYGLIARYDLPDGSEGTLWQSPGFTRWERPVASAPAATE
jgi:hypothetical protein